MTELTMHQFVNRLEIHKDDLDDVFKVMFKADGYDIFNPYLSSCGRFSVEASTYGLTDLQADLLDQINWYLVKANKKIEKTAENCLCGMSVKLQTNNSFWTLDSFEQSKGVEGLNSIGYAMAAFALDSLAKQYA